MKSSPVKLKSIDLPDPQNLFGPFSGIHPPKQKSPPKKKSPQKTQRKKRCPNGTRRDVLDAYEKGVPQNLNLHLNPNLKQKSSKTL